MEPAVRMVHVFLKQSQHDVKGGLDVRMENVVNVIPWKLHLFNVIPWKLPLFGSMKPSLNDFRLYQL